MKKLVNGIDMKIKENTGNDKEFLLNHKQLGAIIRTLLLHSFP